MLYVHHMHTLVCRVFKWNYEQLLYGKTFLPTDIRFARANAPLNPTQAYAYFVDKTKYIWWALLLNDQIDQQIITSQNFALDWQSPVDICNIIYVCLGMELQTETLSVHTTGTSGLHQNNIFSPCK